MYDQGLKHQQALPSCWHQRCTAPETVPAVTNASPLPGAMKAASALRAAGAALRGGARSIGGAPKVRHPFSLKRQRFARAFGPRRPG